MAKRLNQLVANEKSVKAECQSVLTKAYQNFQKPTLLLGLAKSYRPKAEDGDKLPSETQHVQVRANEVITAVSKALVELVDAVATKDATNCIAKADIVVDGKTLATGVPAVHLLWLEKQVLDWKTFIEKLPVLDPTETWAWQPTQNVFATPAVETVRTKKVEKVEIVVPPTDKHPAQTNKFTQDVLEGYWTTVKFSGALPATTIKDFAGRVEKLLRAIRSAHQEANMATSTPLEIGSALVNYVFEK